MLFHNSIKEGKNFSTEKNSGQFKLKKRHFHSTTAIGLNWTRPTCPNCYCSINPAGIFLLHPKASFGFHGEQRHCLVEAAVSYAMSEDVDTRIIERYDLHKRLGKGAYGIVWKAVDRYISIAFN